MALLSFQKRFFTETFPPPRFLTMARMALDISSNSVRFMELVKSKEGLRPGSFGKIKITEGVGYSENVQTKTELKDVLSKLKKEYKLKFVDVSLPEEKAYLFQTTLPQMNEEEIRGNIELQLEENVPLMGNEAVFDYSVINHEAGGNIFVAVSVFPKKAVESYSKLFESVGLVPVTFQLAAEAVARAVIKKGDPGTYMIVNLGEKKTGIYIVNNGIVYFTTTISFGGETLTSGIMKLFNVTKEDAVKIKKEKNFMKEKENVKMFFSSVNPISILKDEIKRLCIYWDTHKNLKKENNQQIKKIILCGEDSNLHGFDEYLTLNLKIETEVANVWANLFSLDDYVPELSFDDSLDYPTVIGLSL